MSPSDLLNIGEELTYFIGSGIAAFGIYRALIIGRAFLNRLYRSRAFWLAFLLLIVTVLNLSSYVPQLNGNGFSINEGLFLLSFFVIYVFVDRNLLITMQVDFFHRNTLHWTVFRWIGYAALILSSIGLALVSAFANAGSSSAPLYVNIILANYFVILAVVLGYSSVALVIGARRTPDRTIRGFVRYLGIALALAVISATIWIIPFVGNFISAVFAASASYGLYLCVMALSPIGKVEKLEA